MSGEKDALGARYRIRCLEMLKTAPRQRDGEREGRKERETVQSPLSDERGFQKENRILYKTQNVRGD